MASNYNTNETSVKSVVTEIWCGEKTQVNVLLKKLGDSMNYHHVMLNWKTAYNTPAYDTNDMVSNKGVDD
jgi:hypothetical protein